MIFYIFEQNHSNVVDKISWNTSIEIYKKLDEQVKKRKEEVNKFSYRELRRFCVFISNKNIYKNK